MVKKSMRNTAIIGFISKGLIYVIIGVLSLLAALNMGGQSSGASQALLFLKKQVFGQFLLTALGVGLLCYSFWMFVRSIKNPDKIGPGTKAKLTRAGYFFTGLVYTFLALLAFYYLFGFRGNGNGDSLLKSLDPSIFSVLFVIIGIVLVLQAIFLAVGVYSGRLLSQFNLKGRKGAHLMRIGGKFGFYSRAFVVAIIAYFFLRAGIYTGSHDMKGISDAFSFLDRSLTGRILMVLTAIGFISYGLFYILLSRFRRF